MSKEEQVLEDRVCEEGAETVAPIDADTQPEEDQKEEAAQDEKKPTKEEEELQTKYMRLAADFQNYKRRVEKEKSDIYAFANEKIVAELLNVIDNFDRSLAIQEECKDEKMLEGMKLIFKQLKDVLDKNNVKEIKTEDTEFDPNFHHAVMTDSSGEYESGKVTEVLQKGYMLNEKVIRPAMVKVAE